MSDLILIQRKIFEIRGQRVMLDRDLAALYQVETRVLNQAVKRNIDRFPDDFMFQLTKEEFESLRSQIATSNDSLRSQSVTIDTDSDGLKSQFATSNGRGGLRYLPYAFTELQAKPKDTPRRRIGFNVDDDN